MTQWFCVYWTEAKAYTDWLSEKTGETYRLLSEAEWEYVARGGVDTKWFWGDDDSKICEYGNVLDQAAANDPTLIAGSGTSMDMAASCNDGYAIVSPVGQFKPNAYGVYDTIGNVWEWTQDCSLKYYPDQPVDGSAMSQLVCVRNAPSAAVAGAAGSSARNAASGVEIQNPRPTTYSASGSRGTSTST